MKAIYPGTFDPITWGHLDVIEAASTIFDEVIVGVLTNLHKEPMFTTDIRVAMILEAASGYRNVKVGKFVGLTVEFAKLEGADVIVRGLRLVMDYESELDISFNNRVLSGGVNTVFIPPKQEHIHIRSSTVRELMLFGVRDELHQYVPDSVYRYL